MKDSDTSFTQELRETLDFEVPKPSSELLEMVKDTSPVVLRNPVRQLSLIVVASTIVVACFLFATGIRKDLSGLSLHWTLLVGLAWLVGFAVSAWSILVPRRGSVMPSIRRAMIAAVSTATGMIAVGFLFPNNVPGISTIYEPSLSSVVSHGTACFSTGLASAAIPTFVVVLFLRAVIPIRSPWVAAAAGAMGGTIGGFCLHFHCSVAEKFHVGLAHGGLVLVAALLAAAIVPRFNRIDQRNN